MPSAMPINELLTNFVMAHSAQHEAATGGANKQAQAVSAEAHPQGWFGCVAKSEGATHEM